MATVLGTDATTAGVLAGSGDDHNPTASQVRPSFPPVLVGENRWVVRAAARCYLGVGVRMFGAWETFGKPNSALAAPLMSLALGGSPSLSNSAVVK